MVVIFRCPKIWAQYSLIIMCSNIGTPKIINFPFGTNGKLIVLGVPILKHFRVLFSNFVLKFCHFRQKSVWVALYNLGYSLCNQLQMK